LSYPTKKFVILIQFPHTKVLNTNYFLPKPAFNSEDITTTLQYKKIYPPKNPFPCYRFCTQLTWMVLIDYDLCQIGIELGELNW